MHNLKVLALCFFLPLFSIGQSRWQQRVDYTMSVDMNVKKNTFTGKQKLVYTNNSPDDLRKVFYHLYFNAFQPGSMMDVRSRSIMDPDPRVKDRISKLGKKEIGNMEILSLTQDGQKVSFEHVGTILEVVLAKPISSGASTTFEMEFEGQVPKQVRRSGRDNAEGIRYSMSQWYPKMCEYDQYGWHANPYIGREFHGVWGNFDVTISIDPSYTVAATGYEVTDRKSSTSKKNWHFKVENVHDFVWAADPKYTHKVRTTADGLELHFYYVEDSLTKEWEKLPEYTERAFGIMNKRFGKYPYKKYSVIQGGDGGMEYPMATLITGHRRLGSLVGVTVHEMIHSWYQGVLATNESLFPWMDEGFTSYATHEVVAQLFGTEDPHRGSYNGYAGLVKAGLAEPMSIHADHYQTNYAYGTNAYSKGTMLLHQLSYVIGQEAFDKGMKTYFETHKFSHPTELDFRRVMEKTSGLELDWYFEYMVNTIHNVDFALETVEKKGGKTRVVIRKVGLMPMPVELVVTTTDGSQEMYYVPLRMMRGEKTAEGKIKRTVLEDWPWTNATYELVLDHKFKNIERLEIDPSHRLADLDLKNNVFGEEEEKED